MAPPRVKTEAPDFSVAGAALMQWPGVAPVENQPSLLSHAAEHQQLIQKLRKVVDRSARRRSRLPNGLFREVLDAMSEMCEHIHQEHSERDHKIDELLDRTDQILAGPLFPAQPYLQPEPAYHQDLFVAAPTSMAHPIYEYTPVDPDLDQPIRIAIVDESVRNNVQVEYDKRILLSIVQQQVKAFGRVSAVTVLRSGDVEIHPETGSDYRQLQAHSCEWLGNFGKGASLVQKTYGILIDNVSPSTMDLSTPQSQLNVGCQLIRQNPDRLAGAEIMGIRWAKRRRGEVQLTSVHVEFTTRDAANALIDRGLNWATRRHRAQKYDTAEAEADADADGAAKRLREKNDGNPVLDPEVRPKRRRMG
jgi:hypothetical protein